MMRSFFFALSFLTRIPIPLRNKPDEKITSSSVAFYPLIGVIIGISLILINRYAVLIFPETITNAIILIFPIYLTGGLHLDGFMDTVDGLFSGRDREKKLEIMHDSNVGSFAVIGLFSLLFLKFLFLSEIIPEIKSYVLLTMPVISRLMMAIVIYSFPVASSSIIANNFFKYLKRKELFFALFFSLIPPLLLISNHMFLYSFVSTLIISLVFTFVIGRRVTKRLGGLTGDVYGAINELVEVIVLMIFTIIQVQLF